MNKKFILVFALITILISNCFYQNEKSTETTEIVWHWESEFSNENKEKIISWLTKTIDATEQTLGKFPFKIHLYIHIKRNSEEPVPWAHTDRSKEQSVHFYIDPTYTLNEFLDDWTAPHEISHLTLPFLGSDYMWFAEGYATYMQCQIMNTLKTMTAYEVQNKYRNKINLIKHNFYCSKPFTSAVDSLIKKHNYPAIYWGGVNYFVKADSLLKLRYNTNLDLTIKKYQKCCRLNDIDIFQLTKSLDSIVSGHLFLKLLNDFNTKPAKVLFH